MGFGGEHGKQACLIHGIVHRTCELSVRLGARGVCLNKRSDTFDLVQKICGHVTRSHHCLLLGIAEQPAPSGKLSRSQA